MTNSTTLRTSVVIAISMLSATLFGAEASAQAAKPAVARNVVLVHGAWADGSSWTEVIARLQAAGLPPPPATRGGGRAQAALPDEQQRIRRVA